MEKRSVDYERRIINFPNIPNVLAGATLTQAGRRRGGPRNLEVAFLVENRLRNAGQLVGKRDRKHVMVPDRHVWPSDTRSGGHADRCRGLFLQQQNRRARAAKCHFTSVRQRASPGPREGLFLRYNLVRSPIALSDRRHNPEALS